MNFRALVMTLDTVAQDIPTNIPTIVTDAPTEWAPTICPRWMSVRSDVMIDQHNAKTITGFWWLKPIAVGL